MNNWPTTSAINDYHSFGSLCDILAQFSKKSITAVTTTTLSMSSVQWPIKNVWGVWKAKHWSWWYYRYYNFQAAEGCASSRESWAAYRWCRSQSGAFITRPRSTTRTHWFLNFTRHSTFDIQHFSTFNITPEYIPPFIVKRNLTHIANQRLSKSLLLSLFIPFRDLIIAWSECSIVLA